MVLAGDYLAAKCSDDQHICAGLLQLPDLCRENMGRFENTGKRIAANEQIAKYAFLGSGSLYGLAREAQLKIKEMVLLPSDSYVSLDYQHGPMSNVDDRMLVTIMVSDAGRNYDLLLAKKMKALGAQVLILCDSADGGFADYADYLVELKSGMGDGLRDILYMPVLQFVAYYKSLAMGCDPDNPKHLSYYVAVEEA